MITSSQREKIRAAYVAGSLRVPSVSPDGVLAWKRVLAVSRAATGSETICRVTTDMGSSVMTGGHRVFTSPSTKLEAEQLGRGKLALSQLGSESVGYAAVTEVTNIEGRDYMYDLTADDWHNFVLYQSRMVVSNSPDRNYHFRPPAHEETIRQYNRVFGFIWEDEELAEYLDRGLDMVIAAPPRTPFQNIDQLALYKPEWKTLLLTGAMYFALNALRINWIADEFSVAAETQVRVILPDGREVDVEISKLYDICHGT